MLNSAVRVETGYDMVRSSGSTGADKTPPASLCISLHHPDISCSAEKKTTETVT